MNLNDKFLIELKRCTDPTIFLGVARVLKVRLVTDQKDENNHFIARPVEEILYDTYENFTVERRERKRELLKIFHKANAKPREGSGAIEGGKDATRTENSEASTKN